MPRPRRLRPKVRLRDLFTIGPRAERTGKPSGDNPAYAKLLSIMFTQSIEYNGLSGHIDTCIASSSIIIIEQESPTQSEGAFPQHSKVVRLHLPQVPGSI